MADQPLTPIPPHAATLPIAGQPTPERADAARNRQKVLDAVARMIATKGVKDLSLDEVAREAGVGVGSGSAPSTAASAIGQGWFSPC